ncbi:EIN3-binding F-box protein 2-like [Impatiens glandulifera]|uniref:EIN3-binding F-box protein 2-like n=1 Tax=Impatiens glandulifera TaxID=253017 RepID=UPI001FB196A9|nr:EIN3-binding F-box protein 2-like [Impatiens glandulifera]
MSAEVGDSDPDPVHDESRLEKYDSSYFFSNSSKKPQNEGVGSVPSIEILPDECLIEIFTRLSIGQSTSSSACVSKRWLKLLITIRSAEFRIQEDENVEFGDDGYLSRSLEGKNATDIRLFAIAIGVTSLGGLGKLMIEGSTDLVNGVSDTGLSAISHYCHSLRVLSLWNTPLVGDQGLLAIANECPLLENIELSHCTRISNYGLAAIAENCPNLIYLTIESCPRINDLGIISLVQSASRLRKLKIHSLRISGISLAAIGYYGKSLDTLILGRLPYVSPKGFWLMGKGPGLKKLESLTVSSCSWLTNAGLEAIGAGCSSLKQINLKKCWFVSDHGLVTFVFTSGSLKSVLLEECHGVTQYGILCVIMKLKSLVIVKCMGIKVLPLNMNIFSSKIRSLSIINCPSFGNIGLTCHRLRNIDFSGSIGITTSDFMAIIKRCTSGLVNVNLSGCLNLTDGVVSAMAYDHGGTLEQLYLEDCHGVSDLSVMAIAEACKTLNELDLSRCSISDFGIAVLACRAEFNLQILSLAGCCNVSDECMPFLGMLGKNLVGLNLKNCSSISTGCLEQLVDTLWRCEVLS